VEPWPRFPGALRRASIRRGVVAYFLIMATSKYSAGATIGLMCNTRLYDHGVYFR